MSVNNFDYLTSQVVDIVKKNCTSCHIGIDVNIDECAVNGNCEENKFFDVNEDPCDSRLFRSLSSADKFCKI